MYLISKHTCIKYWKSSSTLPEIILIRHRKLIMCLDTHLLLKMKFRLLNWGLQVIWSRFVTTGTQVYEYWLLMVTLSINPQYSAGVCILVYLLLTIILWVPFLIILLLFHSLSRLSVISHDYHSFKSIVVLKVYFIKIPFTFFLHINYVLSYLAEHITILKCNISEGYCVMGMFSLFRPHRCLIWL